MEHLMPAALKTIAGSRRVLRFGERSDGGSRMSKRDSFDELWDAPAEPGAPFESEQIAALPLPARRYLEHAIAPATRRATVVRLRMHGSIRLKGTWYPFDADQVIRWSRGFVWRARVRMRGLPVTGFDRWIDGDGALGYSALPFGGVAEKEAPFGGFTIPSQLRIGWHFGTDRFEPEGEFFRCTIDEASFR
jgi:hypothetical protein